MTRPETLASFISVHYEAAKELNDETFISHLAINITLVTFAIGQSPISQRRANSTLYFSALQRRLVFGSVALG
jgi:hypothetical protein